ncbi:MAG: hypothetical protein WCA44_00895 [Acidobacteriaceae bacterium]
MRRLAALLLLFFPALLAAQTVSVPPGPAARRRSIRAGDLEIARAAQHHGQQVDITVLTLEWSGAAVAAV